MPALANLRQFSSLKPKQSLAIIDWLIRFDCSGGDYRERAGFKKSQKKFSFQYFF